jgi:hypothetical protein
MNYKLLGLGILVLVIIGTGFGYLKYVPDKTLPAVTVSTSTMIGMWLPASYLPISFINARQAPPYFMKNGEVYCQFGGKLAEVDVANFSFSLEGGYGKDKAHVYKCDRIVEGADPATFQALDSTYAKDQYHVYANGGILSGADPKTFQSLGISSLATGSSYGADAQYSFSVGPMYGKDATHVWFISNIIPDADPQTFVIRPVVMDKNWIYKDTSIFGPSSLIDFTYTTGLPTVCVESVKTESPYESGPQASIVPDIYSKDGMVVGYGSDSVGVCIVDKKKQTAEYYASEGGTVAWLRLSDDGYQVYLVYSGKFSNPCDRIDRTTKIRTSFETCPVK